MDHVSSLADHVAAAREGDREAFNRVVELTYADTYTLAFRLTGNAEDAADVVQEAYIRAYRSLSKFRGDAKFTTWLYRITANCASTHRSKRLRHRHEELVDEELLVEARDDDQPERVAETTSLRGDLHHALELLPEKLRSVVVLRDVYDLPHEAIAKELGISVTAAKVRLHRARHRLRDLIAAERFEELRRAM